MSPTPEQISSIAMQAVFGRPLITNVHRAVLVEAMVSQALPRAWTWCSGDYAGWDFEHLDGTRLEVKQSAAKQTWETSKPSSICWDIAARKGTYEGSIWKPGIGRNAHIYVLAYNPVIDAMTDHRDPSQWRFLVVDESCLPAQKTMGIATGLNITPAVEFGCLAEAVELMRTARGRAKLD